MDNTPPLPLPLPLPLPSLEDGPVVVVVVVVVVSRSNIAASVIDCNVVLIFVVVCFVSDPGKYPRL